MIKFILGLLAGGFFNDNRPKFTWSNIKAFLRKSPFNILRVTFHPTFILGAIWICESIFDQFGYSWPVVKELTIPVAKLLFLSFILEGYFFLVKRLKLLKFIS